jgi:16S rRNA (guanine527-N7)-methyltransferase
MEPARIAELLQPFLTLSVLPDLCHSEQSEESAVLSPTQLQSISTYIDLLLRWNARINLTAIRQPEEIVTRHFGESLFAARHLFPSEEQCRRERPRSRTAIDIGTGAGFPGLPIKIWAPHIDLTLIESNQKKATFLREVIRTLTLMNVDVFPGRAQSHPNPPADLVTLRAVEHFETTLRIVASLVAPVGRLALLISNPQLPRAKDLTPEFAWTPPIPIPLSSTRILAIAIRQT